MHARFWIYYLIDIIGQNKLYDMCKLPFSQGNAGCFKIGSAVNFGSLGTNISSAVANLGFWLAIEQVRRVGMLLFDIVILSAHIHNNKRDIPEADVSSTSFTLILRALPVLFNGRRLELILGLVWFKL
ncbi:hypothetical protein AB4K20DRAFT_1868282 [Rhizopus microsporus]